MIQTRQVTLRKFWLLNWPDSLATPFRRLFLSSVFGILCLAFSGCGPVADSDVPAINTAKVINDLAASNSRAIEVTSAYFRLMPPGQTVSAGFFQLYNHLPESISIVDVLSDRLERVEIHQHTHDNGVMRMRKVESLSVEAGAALMFKPGGYHLMLFDVPEGIEPEEAINIRLLLASGAEVKIALLARSLVP